MKSRKTRMLVALWLTAVSAFSLMAISFADNAKEIKLDRFNAIQTIPKIIFKQNISATKKVELSNVAEKELIRINTNPDGASTGNNFVLSRGGSSVAEGSYDSTILWWKNNKIEGTNSSNSTIIAWESNQVNSSLWGTIGWWKNNHVDQADYGTVAWWENNSAYRGSSTVVWGSGNMASGGYSVTLWNKNQVNGDYSMAIWNNSKVNASNSFLWSDNWVTLSTNNVFAVVGGSGMVVNTDKAHRFAQLTIWWSLLVNQDSRSKNLECTQDTKWVLKVINTGSQACFCSCDWNNWHSLFGAWNCSKTCGATKDPKCGTVQPVLKKICDETKKQFVYSWTCEVWEVVEWTWAYMVDNQGIVHWTCQTNDGSWKACSSEVKATDPWICSEPAWKYKCTGSFANASSGAKCSDGNNWLTDDNGNAKLMESKSQADSTPCGWYCNEGYYKRWDICIPMAGCPEQDIGDYHIPPLVHNETRVISNNAWTCTRSVTCYNAIPTLWAEESCYSCKWDKPNLGVTLSTKLPNNNSTYWTCATDTTQACTYTCNGNNMKCNDSHTACIEKEVSESNCGSTKNSCTNDWEASNSQATEWSDRYTWDCPDETGCYLECPIGQTIHNGKCEESSCPVNVKFKVVNGDSWAGDYIYVRDIDIRWSGRDPDGSCDLANVMGTEVTQVWYNSSYIFNCNFDFNSWQNYQASLVLASGLPGNPSYATYNIGNWTSFTPECWDKTVTLNVNNMSRTYYITPSYASRNDAGEIDLKVTVDWAYTNLPSDLWLLIYWAGHDGQSSAYWSFDAPGSVSPKSAGNYEGYVGYPIAQIQWTKKFTLYDIWFDGSYSKQTTINWDTYIINRNSVWPQCGSANGTTVPDMPTWTAACDPWSVKNGGGLNAAGTKYEWICVNGVGQSDPCSANALQTKDVCVFYSARTTSQATFNSEYSVTYKFYLVESIPVQVLAKLPITRTQGRGDDWPYSSSFVTTFSINTGSLESAEEQYDGYDNCLAYPDDPLCQYDEYTFWTPYIENWSIIHNGTRYILNICGSATCTDPQPGNNTRKSPATPTINRWWDYVSDTSAVLSACQWTCKNGYNKYGTTMNCYKCQWDLPENAELWNDKVPSNDTTNYWYSATTSNVACKFHCINEWTDYQWNASTNKCDPLCQWSHPNSWVTLSTKLPNNNSTYWTCATDTTQACTYTCDGDNMKCNDSHTACIEEEVSESKCWSTKNTCTNDWQVSNTDDTNSSKYTWDCPDETGCYACKSGYTDEWDGGCFKYCQGDFVPADDEGTIKWPSKYTGIKPFLKTQWTYVETTDLDACQYTCAQWYHHVQSKNFNNFVDDDPITPVINVVTGTCVKDAGPTFGCVWSFSNADLVEWSNEWLTASVTSTLYERASDVPEWQMCAYVCKSGYDKVRNPYNGKDECRQVHHKEWEFYVDGSPRESLTYTRGSNSWMPNSPVVWVYFTPKEWWNWWWSNVYYSFNDWWWFFDTYAISWDPDSIISDNIWWEKFPDKFSKNERQWSTINGYLVNKWAISRSDLLYGVQIDLAKNFYLEIPQIDPSTIAGEYSENVADGKKKMTIKFTSASNSKFYASNYSVWTEKEFYVHYIAETVLPNAWFMGWNDHYADLWDMSFRDHPIVKAKVIWVYFARCWNYTHWESYSEDDWSTCVRHNYVCNDWRIVENTPSAVPDCRIDSCFLEGTHVLTENWYKNIEDVEVWDMVLSYNTKTMQNEYNMVNKKFIHEDTTDELYELVIEGNLLKTTHAHRFYVVKWEDDEYQCVRDEWVAASRLNVWDTLLMNDGRHVKVDSIKHYPYRTTYYNLWVENVNNYYVGEWYLVHNSQRELDLAIEAERPKIDDDTRMQI